MLMLNLLVLYRGKTLGDMRTIAATSNPEIVSAFADILLDNAPEATGDPIIDAMDNLTNSSLSIISKATSHLSYKFTSSLMFIASS